MIVFLKGSREFPMGQLLAKMQRPRSSTISHISMRDAQHQKRLGTAFLESEASTRRSTPMARHQSESIIFGTNEPPIQRSISGGSSLFRPHTCATEVENQPSTSSSIDLHVSCFQFGYIFTIQMLG